MFREAMNAVNNCVPVNREHHVNWVRNVSLLYPLIVSRMTAGILDNLGWAEIEMHAFLNRPDGNMKMPTERGNVTRFSGNIKSPQAGQTPTERKVPITHFWWQSLYHLWRIPLLVCYSPAPPRPGGAAIFGASHRL